MRIKREIFRRNRLFEKMMKTTELKKPTLRTIRWQEIKNGKAIAHTDLTAW
jgi:hypothetical protein